MVVNTLAHTTWELKAEKVSIYGLTKATIMAIGEITKFKVKVLGSKAMDGATQEAGLIAKCMGSGNILGNMEDAMKDNMCAIINRVLENTIGLMEILMKDFGKEGKGMVEE